MSTPVIGAAVFLGNAPAPAKINFNGKVEPTWREYVQTLALYVQALEQRIATLEAAQKNETELVN